ncbi:MAG: S8 family peptidase [Chitinophagaceae bacterium]
MKNLYILFALSVLVSMAVHGQYSRYIIELKDKRGTTFTLANPAAYLSAKTIERRTKQRISIDSSDLPLSAPYLDSIRLLPNVTILNSSKWLNQVCIATTDASALLKIRSFSFVKTAAPVAARIIANTSRQGFSKHEAVYSLATSPNNALNQSTNSINYGNSLNQILIHHGEYLHNQGFTGNAITIAILDAGFMGYQTNPAFDSVRLQNRILGEWDFVANERSVNEDNPHGMYCFSIFAANRPGSMVGSGPGAKFYLFRTEDAGSEYPVEEQNWAAAAERADSLGVEMISSSLGYSVFDDHFFDHSYAQKNGNTTIVTRAADFAAKKGIIVMNSAGNSGSNSNDLKFIECPADGDSVVAVGAVDVNGNIAAFSSWGPNSAGKIKPNIVSVGQGTTIAGLDGNPVSGNGTSFSNPNVAGLIACFWQAFPEFNNMQIIDAIQKSAHKYNSPDERFGFGIPDFKKAFAGLVAKMFKGSIRYENCAATINWTGKDNMNMRYYVERRSMPDTGFTRIGSINGKSQAFSLNSYSFTDTLKSITPNVVQYRLRQVLPEDTTVTLLDTTINTTGSCNTDSRFIVSPNPFTTSLRVTINVPEPISRLSIALYNMKGQRLYYYETAKGSGSFLHTIAVSHLPAGGYFVTLRDNKKMLFSSKLLK